MKTPDFSKTQSSTLNGENSNAPGRLPAKQSGVQAEILARLLNSERLTGLDAVTAASTTRLSAMVFNLANKYGWPIKSTKKLASCSDGRLVRVSEYTLLADTVVSAIDAGAAAWCSDVQEARRAQRAKAPEVRKIAAWANAVRKTHLRPEPSGYRLTDLDLWLAKRTRANGTTA